MYWDAELDSALPMDCASIKQRSFFQENARYEEEVGFGLAFARAVYRVGF